jgi:uncharacterized membrane protein YjjP (DUF1212 family)
VTTRGEVGARASRPAGAAPAEAPDRPLQVRFVAQLGGALSAADDPVSATQHTLNSIAASYGLPEAEIAVLPTMLLVRAREHGLPTVDLGSDGDKRLRLDQVGQLYAIVDRARRGELTAADGLARLAEMWATPPRFGAAVRVVGHVVLTLGLGLILTPRPTALAWCAGLGLLVGLLRELGERWAWLEVLLPVVASVAVSVVVFLGTAAGLIVSPLLLLLPPLITFLPGGTLTTAMIELADHQTIAGATRLVAGTTQVVLLVFGIVVGQTLVGIHPAQAFAQRTDNLLGWWAPWLGTGVFAIGVYFHFVGPRRSLPWLLLVVYVARVGELLGAQLLGDYLGGFVGAVLMALVAYTADWVGGAPASRVLFLPAFWYLVPGVLAVVGLTELVGSDLEVALLDLSTVAFTIISIALGVLVGVALARALPRSRRLPGRRD